MKEQLVSLYRVVRNFLFSIVNREFLIFLFFLIVSGMFWMLTALNETIEREYRVPVSLVGVPKDVVITTDINDTLRVTLRDKGFTLAAYMYWRTLRPLKINFHNYTAKDNGRAQVQGTDLLRQLSQQLYSSTKITSMKPDRLEFFYNHGISKRVPVRLIGQIVPEKTHYLARTIYSPTTVTVYASRQLLDSIRYADTEQQRIINFEDTVVRTVALRTIRGAKIVPSKVQVTLCPDIMTEETVEVPIEAVGMPAGKVLRTFPSRVRVHFVVGANQYRQIRPEQFRVEADYNELAAHPSEKCNIYLRKAPGSGSNPRLDIQQVDYLIEQ